MPIVIFPEPRINITSTAFSDKCSELDYHIVECSQRYAALEDRVTKLEKTVNEISRQSNNNHRLIIRIWLTIGISILISFLIAYFKII